MQANICLQGMCSRICGNLNENHLFARSFGRICPSFVFHEFEYIHFDIHLYNDLSTALAFLLLVVMGMGYNQPGVAYLSYKHNCDFKKSLTKTHSCFGKIFKLTDCQNC